MASGSSTYAIRPCRFHTICVVHCRAEFLGVLFALNMSAPAATLKIFVLATKSRLLVVHSLCGISGSVSEERDRGKDPIMPWLRPAIRP